MSGKNSTIYYHLERLLAREEPAEILRRLDPSDEPKPNVLAGGSQTTPEAIEARWRSIAALRDLDREALCDADTQENIATYGANIENCIGTVKIPVGVVGPLRVRGLFASGDYLVPLATTEAALVASYSRGARLITMAGGALSMLVNEAVSRAPAFAFENLRQAGEFVVWALGQGEVFEGIVAGTTAHGKLLDMSTTVEGNHVYLHFEYATGDASGQNMVTIATQAICDWILKNSPVTPRAHYVEGNLSGDKKASAQAFTTVRGKKVSAEIEIPGRLLQKYLHTTADKLVDYWQMSAMGGVLSGTIGVQGHFANALAALYIACGQDAACVAESAVGITRFERSGAADLYATVTLPNIMVGTVGGGTQLPSQRACLELLGLAGGGKSQALSEVCGALVLAGELSIIGALVAGHFTRAHQRLARER